MLRIAIAQLNPTVGDFDGNAVQIIDAMQRAAAGRADLVAFPELAVCGYYPGDLLEEPRFLRNIEAALERIIAATRALPGLTAVIGAPRRNTGPGKPLFNALLAVREGAIVAEYHKQLLPVYGVFDDGRHFEAGPEVACVLPLKGVRVGFLICEDGWNDDLRSYRVNPFQKLADAGAQLVLSINASPSDVGKRAQRHTLFRAACLRRDMALLYVNQVGGQDQLVYDGASFAMSPQQGLAFEAARFAPDFQLLAFEDSHFLRADGAGVPQLVDETLATPEFYRRQIILGLRDYARRCGFERVVVGSSGGIDSALTIALAAEALGPQNVVAVTMPSRFSSTGSVDDSETLCRALGVQLFRHPIADLVREFEDGFAKAFSAPLRGLPLENLQARVRGAVLMEYSNGFGALLLTTGNKSEISVGYCTLYGDTNGGLGLIGDLYKTEVYALARHLNAAASRELIPGAVLDKPPSAELAPDQRDTDSLPPYEVLDEILKWHIEGDRLPAAEARAVSAFVENLRGTEEGAALVERICRLIARNEYKRRQSPPVIRVRTRAFGSGRQIPIAVKY
ncbi:NAD+ synthase [Herbaspirillum chlorophenolicum]|uniref:NAD+ synthase n=1 Tax=Herbaspirillum chlorophenolicum TaxID=211589 RepID=UPI00067D6688|nr:NAD+ synthase [Herbaspirillum chlorophenolicum]